jgi:hypothetical protein
MVRSRRRRTPPLRMAQAAIAYMMTNKGRKQLKRGYKWYTGSYLPSVRRHNRRRARRYRGRVRGFNFI